MYLVTGAGGNVGREVATALRDHDVPVRGLYRAIPDSRVPGVTPVVGDLNDPDSLTEAFRDVEGVFLLPGYADMPGLVRLAERGGSRIVLLSGSSAGVGDLDNAITAYMVRSERAVHAADVPWTILRPSAFMSNTFRWIRQLAHGDTVTLPFADVPIACLDPTDIAAVAAVALLGDGHDRATHRLTGPAPLTAREQVATVGRTLGRDVAFVAESDADARDSLAREMPRPYAAALIDFYVDGALDESDVLTTVADLTGRPPATYEDWTVRHRVDLASAATPKQSMRAV